MKKKIAFLLAAVMLLALAGCGGGSADVPDHVVDYKVDVPDGFEPIEQEGLAACWYAGDGSNINLNITDKDATTDLGFKAITADMLRTTMVAAYKEATGVEPTIEDRYFGTEKMFGLDAYQYSYDIELGGQSMVQIVVCINADQTYTFTYTTSDPDLVEVFDASAKGIQLTLE